MFSGCVVSMKLVLISSRRVLVEHVCIEGRMALGAGAVVCGLKQGRFLGSRLLQMPDVPR